MQLVAAALLLAALACQAKEECKDGLQRPIGEAAGKLNRRRAEAEERESYLRKRLPELTMLDTSAEELVDLVHKDGLPWLHRICERLAGEVKEAEKSKHDDVRAELEKAESLATGAIPGLERYSDGLITQLNKARELVSVLFAKGKGLLLVMREGLEHDAKDSSTAKLRRVKAKVAREHPKLDKIGFEILDVLGNLTEKMGSIARAGRGFTLKVITALNNCMEKLEGKEDAAELRSELQDHENSIWENDVWAHSTAEKIGRQIAQGRDIMNDIQTYAMRYTSDYGRWMAEDIEEMEQIEELQKK